jgi:hypothetical protein
MGVCILWIGRHGKDPILSIARRFLLKVDVVTDTGFVVDLHLKILKLENQILLSRPIGYHTRPKVLGER